MDVIKMLIQMVPEAEKHLSSGLKTNSSLAELLVEAYNSRTGNLPDYDCPTCQNRGMIAVVDDRGEYSLKECACMPKRRILHHARKSGMGELLKKSFEGFEAAAPYQIKLRDTAKAFVNAVRSGDKPWMMAIGQSGCGKTHICAAACNTLLESGFRVHYMSWNDEVGALKRSILDQEAYNRRMDRIQQAPVLYIDDLLKGSYTDADTRIAFEILNYRVNNQLVTVISTERQPDELIEIEEATFSRAIEMSRDYLVTVAKDRSKNYRLRGILE